MMDHGCVYMTDTEELTVVRNHGIQMITIGVAWIMIAAPVNCQLGSPRKRKLIHHVELTNDVLSTL